MKKQRKVNAKMMAFNIPIDINLNNMFPSSTDGMKACFLLHQINHYSKEGGYTINTTNHDWLFGKNGTTSRILKVLIQNEIIKRTSDLYIVGSLSYKYEMIKPFIVSEENDKKGIYKTEFIQKNGNLAPLFIQKFVADNYKIMDSSTTKFVKVLKSVPKQIEVVDNVSIPTYTQSYVDSLLSDIEALKRQLAEANRKLEHQSMVVQPKEVEIVNDNSQIVESHNKPIGFVAEALEEFFNFQHEKNNEYMFDDFKLFQLKEDVKVIIYNDALTLTRINHFIKSYIQQAA